MSEEENKIERSGLFQKILSIVKQIPRKEVSGDSMDASSASHLIEQLFKSQNMKTEEKDVFDTGARLPEQKEESQEKLWDDVLSLQGMFTDQGVCYDGNRAAFLEKLKSKFLIHRKP